MRLKQLFDDDSAVSPVIGVILMVAITVILAAVIATFVLGLGEQVGDTAPNANFNIDQETEAGNLSQITITHTSGPSIDSDDLKVTFSANDSDVNEAEIPGTNFSADSVSAGDSVQLNSTEGLGNTDFAELEEGDTVNVVFESDDGDSAILARAEVVADAS